MDFHPYLFCLSFYLLYFVLPPFKDNGLSFGVPDVLCQHSEVVLWNLLNVQMFFLDEFVREKVVSLSYSSATLGPPRLVFINLSLKACREFGSFKHKLPSLLAWWLAVKLFFSTSPQTLSQDSVQYRCTETQFQQHYVLVWKYYTSIKTHILPKLLYM